MRRTLIFLIALLPTLAMSQTNLDNWYGNWSGTYSGDDAGNCALTIDFSNSSQGRVTGSCFSNYERFFSIVSGSVAESGGLVMTAGSTNTGATFSGAIFGNFFSGTWANPYWGESGTFQLHKVSPTPPFPLLVSGAITDTSATLSTRILFNAADKGKTGSVYVTAWVPAKAATTLGFAVAGKPERQPAASIARAPAKTIVAAGETQSGMVLIQLTASGWQQVTNGQLLPYATGVLNDQMSAQNILNSTDTANLKGAQFCVGYGTTAGEMTAANRMRKAADVPDSSSSVATASCIVSAVPQSGWWWNKSEPGRGYFIETKSGRHFTASYLYEDSGTPVWFVTGPGDTSGTGLAGVLGAYSNGQTLTSSWVQPNGPSSAGNIVFTFSDPSHGTISWPGGSVPIIRYEIVDGSLSLPAPAFQPETGWWWNASEGGRGFSIEVQGNLIFVAGFMYEAAGNPVWYVSGGNMTTDRLYVGNWQRCSGGMSMSGTFRPTTCNDLAYGSVSLNFTSTTTAALRLPNGQAVNLTRFTF